MYVHDCLTQSNFWKRFRRLLRLRLVSLDRMRRVLISLPEPLPPSNRPGRRGGEAETKASSGERCEGSERCDRGTRVGRVDERTRVGWCRWCGDALALLELLAWSGGRFDCVGGGGAMDWVRWACGVSRSTSRPCKRARRPDWRGFDVDGKLESRVSTSGGRLHKTLFSGR